MASKFKVSNKKTIIAIAAIIILLIIAVTGTVVFLRDRGSTEAADYTTTDTNEQVASNNQEQVQNEEQQAQSNDQAANQEDTETPNSNEETTTTNPETTTGTTENNEGTTTGATETTGATTGTGTTSGTTTTTETIQESTITRTETEEVMVAENFLVGWQPLSLNVDEASSRINAEETDLEVVKTAKTETGENLVFAGDDITYTISVTNKSQRDLNNIEISDTVPALTTLKSIDDEGVETQGKIKWEKDIKAGETVEVSFTVTVNEGATGTVRNVAIANGEESQEEQTAIITSQKTSEITRKGQVVSEPAMIGDEITYTISITNTGDKEGTTTVKDSNLEEILANGKAEMVGNVTIYKGEEVVSTDKTAQDLISGIENIVVPANGSAKVVFTIKVNKIDGKITNVALIGDETEEPTNPEETDTFDVTIKKEVKDIIRAGEVASEPVKAGDIINYNIILKNIGSVEGEVNVSDVLDNTKTSLQLKDSDGNIVEKLTLAEGEEKVLTTSYTVEQALIDAQEDIKNIATVTYDDEEKTSEVTTPVEDENPAIDVVKTATKINGNDIKEGDKVKAGDKITYTITVKNTGNITLKDINVTDDLKVSYDENKDGVGDKEIAPNGTIKTIATLAPNGEDTIQVIYTVEQTDVDNYDRIKNVATATVPNGPSNNGEDENVPTDKTATIDVVKTATKINGNNIKEGDKVKAGDKITYTITVKNTGYTTLKNIVVTDELEVSYDENKDGVGDTTVAPEATIKTIASLAPDEEDTIEVIYTVTQTDVDTYETIRNVATATVPDGPSDEDDETTPTDNTPSIDVVKTAEEIKAVGSSEFVELNRDAQGNITSYVENVGDIIRYTITATNNGAKVLENVNVIDQNHNVKVLKITKGTNVYEQTGKEDDITAGTNLLNFLPDVENRTLEPGESYVIEVEYTVENVNNVSAIENTAVATATPRNEQTPVSDNDDEDVPVAQKLGNSIIKTAVKVNDQTLSSDEDRNNVKLHANDVVTYEITVSNDGNKDLTGVAVTDDHNVTVTKIEKVNADGTRTEDRELKRNATATNLLGKTKLAAGETYVITVTYRVPDNYIDESDPVNGDKLINIATVTTNETGSKSEDDTLVKDKKANITQSKTSKVVGNDEDDHIINSGDIIEYTITVNNDGNITGTTTVKDSKLRENIQNDKVFMMNGETTLSKDDSLTTECINVTSSLGTTTTISVNKLADGYTLGVSSGETITMTFRVEVGKLLPGETVINTLDEQENTYTENEVEASITVNKELVKPQNTVIVIDLSLSMAQSVNYSGSGDPMADTYEETRWYALTEALDKFLDNYMDGNNKVTIIGYNERVKAEHILITDTASKTDAMNSYRNVFTREQYNFVPEQYKGDVDNLIEYKDNHDKNSGTLLASGTNIEAGMIKVQEILHGKEQGAQVILMTDGVANRAMRDNGTIINDDDFSDTYEGIDRASSRATTLKNSGTTMYTISLSLGKSNETYTTKLEDMASEDENGNKLSTSANDITEIINYFKKISEIISEYHGTLTTKDGILVLTNTAFNIDSRYVQNVIITIPNDETDETFTLTWPQFSKYYDPVAKTIDIKQFAIDKNIQGITGDITIDINVDPTINTNAD